MKAGVTIAQPGRQVQRLWGETPPRDQSVRGEYMGQVPRLPLTLRSRGGVFSPERLATLHALKVVLFSKKKRYQTGHHQEGGSQRSNSDPELNPFKTEIGQILLVKSLWGGKFWQLPEGPSPLYTALYYTLQHPRLGL